MQGTLRTVVVLVSLALVGGCDLRLNEHVMDARESESFRKGNRVDLVQFNHMVSFPGGRDFPTDAELDRLDAFMNAIHLGYADEVTLRGGATTRQETLAIYIRRLGLPVNIRMESGTPKEKAASKVKVLVERHVVTPPSCPDWSNFDGNEERNTPGSHYGCSVDASLGYMVANPRDLVEGQEMGPALGRTFIEAQRRYQNRQVTPPPSVGTGG